jgi:hypothetical protein
MHSNLFSSIGDNPNEVFDASKPTNLIEHLKIIINQYLKTHPHLSVNAISKKSNVSEPTLRRIVSGRIKTLPQITTVLDILTFLSNTNSLREIVKMYPGPIGEYLLEAMPHLEQIDQDYSNQLNEELKNPIKYLIYKLAINSMGVTAEKITELYGNHGIQLLNEMINSGFIYKDQDEVFRTQVKSFSSNHGDFVRNFKLVADFIKTNKHRNRKPLNPFFVNASESITPEAYEQISRLQRSTQKKIRQILSDPQSLGNIPTFFICALDSLDIKSPLELSEDN